MFVAACARQSTGASETPEAADFRMICEEATTPASTKDIDARATAFAHAVDVKLRATGSRKVWNAAGMEANNAKLATLREGAGELNVRGWDCPALTTLYGPQAAK